jgi:hypothetical protein
MSRHHHSLDVYCLTAAATVAATAEQQQPCWQQNILRDAEKRIDVQSRPSANRMITIGKTRLFSISLRVPLIVAAP